MNPRLIFLDIDGVLNSTAWAESRPRVSAIPPEKAIHAYEDQRLDPDCVSRLQWLAGEACADLVLTSTWRLRMPQAEVVRLLELYGYAHPPLIGLTPMLRTVLADGRDVTRGHELEAWLSRPGTVRRPYVGLDDEPQYLAHQPLVLTDPDLGLQDHHVRAALALFSSR